MCIHSGDTLDEGELPFCHNSFCVVDVMERCYDFCIFLLLLDTPLLRSGAVQSSELFRFFFFSKSSTAFTYVPNAFRFVQIFNLNVNRIFLSLKSFYFCLP